MEMEIGQTGVLFIVEIIIYSTLQSHILSKVWLSTDIRSNQCGNWENKLVSGGKQGIDEVYSVWSLRA